MGHAKQCREERVRGCIQNQESRPSKQRVACCFTACFFTFHNRVIQAKQSKRGQ